MAKDENEDSVERWRRALADFARATKDLPNDTEVAEFGPDGQLRLMDDLGDKIRAARNVRERVERLVANPKNDSDKR